MININICIESKEFMGRKILMDKQLSIQSGDFIVITGPSGVGKSTLLNIIGLLDLDFSGYYSLNNENLSIMKRTELCKIRKEFFGYVFQDSFINDKQSIVRNVISSVDFSQKSEAKLKVKEILNMVGLYNLRCDTSVLSGGEKQRLSLARALIKSPSVLLADEPTASLDTKNKVNIMKVLKRFNQSGGVVVMVTHDLNLITSDMKLIQLSSL